MVLDASAVLALLYTEPGADLVQRGLPGAVMSAVNLSEVIGKLAEDGLDSNEIREATALGFDIIPFDETLAHRAGELVPDTRVLGLSLGDRACLATALEYRLPVLTADRVWHKLDLGVEIRLVR